MRDEVEVRCCRAPGEPQYRGCVVEDVRCGLLWAQGGGRPGLNVVVQVVRVRILNEATADKAVDVFFF